MKMAAKAKSVSKPEKKNHFQKNNLSHPHLAKAIIANAGIGIYIVQHGNFDYVSELYQKLSGYTDKELIGTYSLNYIYSDDRDMVREKAIKCLKGESFEPYEYRFVKKNDEIMWVLETITPIVYKEERATLGSFMDITGRKKVEEKLHKEEQRFRALAEQSSDIIVIVNRERVISYENPAITRFLGLNPEERIGANVYDNIHPDDFNIVTAVFNTLFADTNAPAQQIAVRLRNKNGSWNTFEAVASNLVYNNVVEAVMVNLRDITERKRAEEELRENEEKYRLIFEYSPLGLLSFDEKGVIVACNENFIKIIGSSRKKLIGLNLFNLPDKNIVSAVQKALNGSHGLYEGDDSSVTAKKITPVRCLFTPMDAGGGRIPGGVGIIEDITERKKAEETLRKSEQRYLELSIIDDLTQLYNSRHFYAQLEKEIERSNRYEQPLTILLLDLDDFKMFNDTYGHVEGDYVLSRLGEVIKRCLRETDSAYRYGGEEFTVILPMTTSEEGLATAKRIQTELEKEAFYPAGQKVHLTVSTGLSQYKLKEEMKAFVHRVDQLMYDAKKSGKDRICYESQHQEQFNC